MTLDASLNWKDVVGFSGGAEETNFIETQT